MRQPDVMASNSRNFDKTNFSGPFPPMVDLKRALEDRVLATPRFSAEVVWDVVALRRAQLVNAIKPLRCGEG